MNSDPCIQYSKRLHTLLVQVISKNLSSSTVIGVLFSGGLDSSVIATILKTLQPSPFQLFVAGIDSAKDIELARKAATALHLPLTLCGFDADAVEAMLPTILAILGRVDVLHVELAIPLFFAAKYASQFGINTLFSGQGADELFGGYAKYEKRIVQLGEQSVLTEMESDLHTLHEHTLPLMKDILSHSNVKLVVPFCDKTINDFATSLPFTCKIVQDSGIIIRKQILRLLAEKLDLPPQIVNAPKRALQYGSGAHRILTDLAANYWIEQNPELSQRKARTHTRIEQYLTQLINS